MLWSRPRLTIFKNQRYFSLRDHQLPENLVFFSVCKKGQKEEKSKFVTKSVGIIVTIISMYKDLSNYYKTFANLCFSTDHLNHKAVNKTTYRTSTANHHQLWRNLLKSFQTVAVNFLGFQDFLISLAKYFWSILNSPNLATQQCFARAM